MFSQVSFLAVVGLIVRGLLMIAAGWLMDHKILPEGTGGPWVDAGVLVVVGYLWSYVEKWQAKQKQDVLIATAIQAPPGATISDVHDTVDAGEGAPVK